MEITRTYDVLPDGFEVESATLRVPSEPLGGTEPIHSGGIKERLDSMRRTGLDRLHRMQRTMSTRSSSMKNSGMQKLHGVERTIADHASSIRSSVSNRVNDLKPMVRDRAMQLKEDVHSNAGRWAGIAAGVGLVLGIGGRIMRHRMRDRYTPQFVIIESTW